MRIVRLLLSYTDLFAHFKHSRKREREKERCEQDAGTINISSVVGAGAHVAVFRRHHFI